MKAVPYRSEDPGTQPPLLFEAYGSTRLRAPLHPLVKIPQTPTELTGPSRNWHLLLGPQAADLTALHEGAPLGQRIIVSGRVLDQSRRPVPNTVIEIWQANAAGRYVHMKDQWDAPLDPNFTGTGRAVTDRDGRYRFLTIKPGAYPWKNHYNAWRPAHIHLSLLGPAFATRLVTQMYFPDDPLVPLDPIAGAVPEPYRRRLVCRFDIETTRPASALGFLFDMVLRGPQATPFEQQP